MNANEEYFENLTIRYNPNTTMIKELIVNNKTDFAKEIIGMISNLIYESADIIQERYEYEIGCWWDEAGEYIVYLQDYGLKSVSIDIGKL